MGEEPVLYDSVQARLSSEDLTVAMQNMGYMNATVDVEKKVKGKKLTLNLFLYVYCCIHITHILHSNRQIF